MWCVCVGGGSGGFEEVRGVWCVCVGGGGGGFEEVRRVVWWSYKLAAWRGSSFRPPATDRQTTRIHPRTQTHTNHSSLAFHPPTTPPPTPKQQPS